MVDKVVFLNRNEVLVKYRIKMFLVDLFWDVNLKKRNGALLQVTDDKVPVLNETLQNELMRHATHSKSKHFEIRGIQIKKVDAGYKLIVSISRNFEKEKLGNIISTIENWIGSILTNNGQTDVSIFYDEDR